MAGLTSICNGRRSTNGSGAQIVRLWCVRACVCVCVRVTRAHTRICMSARAWRKLQGNLQGKGRLEGEMAAQ